MKQFIAIGFNLSVFVKNEKTVTEISPETSVTVVSFNKNIRNPEAFLNTQTNFVVLP